MVEKIKRLPLIGTYVLLAYMPFHLFLSRWLSTYTGGLGIWDGAKDILTLILLGVSLVLAIQLKLHENKWVRWFFCLALVYGLLHLAFIVFDNNNQDLRSWMVATLYNGRIFAYLFIAVVAGYGVRTLPKKQIFKIILIASTVTCLFALMQYVLPKDLMTHFGYTIERGAKPSFFIDDKPDFPRVMSTVRDPNSYGAYLILPLSLLWAYLLSPAYKGRRLVLLGLFGLHGLALFLTFSRGAWLGGMLSLGLVTMLAYHNELKQFVKKYALPISISVLLLLGIGFALRQTYVFKNVILHSDESTVLADPNELRVQLQNDAISGIVDNPQGHGPASAGLAAIGNPKGGILTENYYLQIAHEIGLIGLGVFLAILVITYRLIARSADSTVASIVVASFWGYALVAMLIHLWSNEAVAAQWWLLTGLVGGFTLRNSHNKTKKPKLL